MQPRLPPHGAVPPAHAYDEEHVDARAAFVAARMRERHASPTMARPADRSDAAHERGDRPRHHDSLPFRGGPYRAANGRS
ncbi:hypothetical protein [Streptomyces dubilierae]|uniref:Uncharacterized protein n=1 Tax=Streptomyces dubilierae TaxID=3075533 RepID=A0ABU2PGQ1_9ACTN|nr:hypothetical protein [Streptomyces sp. DSM 41921]MDT0391021.1 hypothetical protein [Streptomyces sp. DSM 41921]